MTMRDGHFPFFRETELRARADADEWIAEHGRTKPSDEILASKAKAAVTSVCDAFEVAAIPKRVRDDLEQRYEIRFLSKLASIGGSQRGRES